MEIKTYEVFYGSFQNPSSVLLPAKSVENAKTAFRKEYGYDHIKIVGVKLID